MAPMCGIGALLDPAGTAPADAGARMTAALRHRGPVRRLGAAGLVEPRVGRVTLDHYLACRFVPPEVDGRVEQRLAGSLHAVHGALVELATGGVPAHTSRRAGHGSDTAP